jgi:hypothetical protein
MMVQLKNLMKTLKDLSGLSPRSDYDKRFGYCLADIDGLSANLGIVWEKDKDQSSASSTICIGFLWDVENRTVSLSSPKVSKYLLAIHRWRLYGKLLHTCKVAKHGRAYLTSLENMLKVCGQ